MRWIAELLAKGHVIAVDERGAVTVAPPCHPDVAYHLRESASDVRAILRDRAPVAFDWPALERRLVASLRRLRRVKKPSKRPRARS